MPNFLSENINDILSIARLAPSVHNTQPWQVKVDQDELIISVNKHRVLTHGDPTGRQTYISLGIFTESCVVALEHLGFEAKVSIADNGEIKIQAGGSSQKAEAESDVRALKTRFTDRSVYKRVVISEAQKSQIENAWRSKNVAIKVIDQSTTIEKVASLTKRGLLIALSSPEFRKELVHHLVPSSKIPYGIPLQTLNNKGFRSPFVKRLIASGLSRKREAELEYKRWLSASALVFILAEGDFKEYWLESGRAYLRASLAIEKLGLGQATSAATVEAGDFHEEIEKLLKTRMRLQSVLRIGKGSDHKKRSGRYSVQDLMAT